LHFCERDLLFLPGSLRKRADPILKQFLHTVIKALRNCRDDKRISSFLFAMPDSDILFGVTSKTKLCCDGVL